MLELFSARDDVDIFDRHGRILYFSLERFINDIAAGHVCFICGADPNSTEFNDEHVIPDWVLSMFNLHSRRIALPNGADLMYGRYTVPCCQECNSSLSEQYERTISSLVKQGYKAVVEYCQNRGPMLLFTWLCLVFLKVHLKDKELRLHLDHRKGAEKLADLYDWRELHHIHCVSRAFYTEAKLKRPVLGSTLVLPVRAVEGEDKFDYADSFAGRTIMLRLGEVCFIAVLNDAGGVQALLGKAVASFKGPLSSLQLRELMTRMAFANMHLKNRPKFHSLFGEVQDNPRFPTVVLADGPYNISADLPDEPPEVGKFDPTELGKMLAFNVKGAISPSVPQTEREAVLNQLKDGEHSLLIDEAGTFLCNPIIQTDD